MEEIIAFPILPTNIGHFSPDLLQNIQNTNKTCELFWQKRNCRSESSENSTIEQTGLTEWITFNITSAEGVGGVEELFPNFKVKSPSSCPPSICMDLHAAEEKDRDADYATHNNKEAGNYFSHSDEVIFNDDDDDHLLVLDRHLPNSDLVNPMNPVSQEIRDEPLLLHGNPSQEIDADLSTSTYQSPLPLVVDPFQPPTTLLGSPTPPSLNAFSFQQLLVTSSVGNHDDDLSSKSMMSGKSQLPPISEFQVSMKLNDEADNPSSLVDDGNPAKHLFNEGLFESLSPSELESSHNTWSLENLLNLSLPLPSSSDETLSTNRNIQANSTQGYYHDPYPTLLAQGIGSHMSPSNDLCPNSSFHASLFLQSDPLIQLRDEDNKQYGDLTNQGVWNHLGSLIEGSYLNEDNAGWLGMTSLEMEQKRDNFDNIEDLSFGYEGKCSKVFSDISLNFTSVANGPHKTHKHLDKRFTLNVNGKDGLLCRCEDSKPNFNELLEQRRERIDMMVPRKNKRSICLWQFLKELLLYPDSYQTWIRWVDQNKGVFKIEDSVNVARLWGQRKNKPAMNYDKLSRSIRQYYKKGIIKKTTSSKRLVYQFCPQYL